MGRSEKTKDSFGNEYVRHYDDDGNFIGTSENSKSFLGDEYVRHHDADGNFIGTSENSKTFLGDEYVRHHDADGNFIGTSEKAKDSLGNEYIAHHDADGNLVGTSEERNGLFGNRYMKHNSSSGGSGLFSGGGAADGKMFVIIAIACIFLNIAFKAFSNFLLTNEALITRILSLWLPLAILVIVPLNYLSKNRTLTLAGVLEGVCCCIAAMLSALLAIRAIPALTDSAMDWFINFSYQHVFLSILVIFIWRLVSTFLALSPFILYAVFLKYISRSSEGNLSDPEESGGYGRLIASGIITVLLSETFSIGKSLADLDFLSSLLELFIDVLAMFVALRIIARLGTSIVYKMKYRT